MTVKAGVLFRVVRDWEKFREKDTEELEEREPGVMKGEKTLGRNSCEWFTKESTI
jgi:hypothetical protein